MWFSCSYDNRTIEFEVPDSLVVETHNMIQKITESLIKMDRYPNFAVSKAMDTVKCLSEIAVFNSDHEEIPFLMVPSKFKDKEEGKNKSVDPDHEVVVERPGHMGQTTIALIRHDSESNPEIIVVNDEVTGAYHPDIQKFLNKNKEEEIKTFENHEEKLPFSELSNEIDEGLQAMMDED